MNLSLLNLRNKFGWIPDLVDTRDIKLSTTSFLTPSTAPDEIENSLLFRGISNQSSFPSCTANAAADAWESAEIVQHMNAGMTLPEAINIVANLSRMFIWFAGRQLMDPPRGYDINCGCFNRLTMDVINRHGVCKESIWPYIAENASRRPSLIAYRDAIYHRSAGFYSIPETGLNRHELLLLALTNKHPIVFGTALDSTFGTYTQGVLELPKGAITGLHAMIICGWSASRDAYRVRNSWGAGWGDKGHLWMSREYICDYEWTHSLWVPTFLPSH